ncbi:unnamed protein product [Brassica oleracea var. botrytis]
MVMNWKQSLKERAFLELNIISCNNCIPRIKPGKTRCQDFQR